MKPSRCRYSDATCRKSRQRRPAGPVPEIASEQLMTNPSYGSDSGLNLTTHRAPVSVWDRSGWDGTREQLTITRWLVGARGAALAVQGPRQRSVPGGVLAALSRRVP